MTMDEAKSPPNNRYRHLQDADILDDSDELEVADLTWIAGTVIESGSLTRTNSRYVVLYEPSRKRFFYGSLKDTRNGTAPKPGQSMRFTVEGDGESPPESLRHHPRDYTDHTLLQANDLQAMNQDSPLDRVPITRGRIIPLESVIGPQQLS